MIYKKIYWKVSNFFESRIKQIMGAKGLLRTKPDPRDADWKYEDKPEFKAGFDDELGANIPEVFSRFKFYYDQSPNNDCVFASGGIGYSEQEGIRMSIRWIVKNAKRMKLTTGNGWSYLRAMPEVAKSVGLLPYELMPDEVDKENWNKYTEWTKEDDRLLAEAGKYKITDYRWITTRAGLIDAITNGYVPLTAGKWFSDMNNPSLTFGYLLRAIGYFIGGHAYRLTGWSFFGKYFEAPQTFSRSYGLDTKAWLENPFGANQFGIYVMSKLPLNVKVEHFKKFYNHKIVRPVGDNACFYIDNGVKKHIPTIEVFWYLVDLLNRGDEKLPYDSHTNIGTSRIFDDDVNPDVLNAISQGDDVLHI